MKSRYLALAAFVAAVLLLPVRNVEACGPFFEDDVFVQTTNPDDLASFAKGQLGILQAGFDSDEYAVAYRYLNGGTLSSKEQSALKPPSPNPDFETPQQWQAQQDAEKAASASRPPNLWLKARAQYAPPATPAAPSPSFPTDYEGNIVFDPNYLNCPDDAFARATLTLKSRAAAWGKQSPWLVDWIHGQDAVFSNCDGKNVTIPSPAATGSPALLRADRAYQIAAATFYAKQFDEAARQFAAIAADSTSPWRSWGQYLTARATVREAFAMGKPTNPYSGNLASYDAATMQHAQQMLEALLAQPNPTPPRAIIQSELNFIRIRTEPEKRAAEISAALAGPGPDPNFAQDLEDVSFLLVMHVAIKNPPPLLAWIAAWRGSGTAASSYALWQQSHALPWLVMALAKAGPSDTFVSELLEEAAKIAPASPAYDTVFYHRVRLLAALKRTNEARALLDAALSALRQQKPNSKLNALLGERASVACDLNEFLQFAPRATLATGSEGAQDLQGQCNARAHAVNAPAPCPEAEHPQEFDEDAAQILNRQTPLSLLIQAANTQSLPQNLRQNLAIVAWTRSVLLDDAKSAAALAPLLPKSLGATAGSSVGFPADLAILRNPGIRPYLEPGIPRVASFSYFDEFRDNWWCSSWQALYSEEQQKPTPLPVPAFLSSDQLAQAAAEYQRLKQLPDSATVIGQRVIDYANQNPNDPEVPEALALTVRATHYACQTYEPNQAASTTSGYTPVSKAAFELLHQRYPKSPWTAKTPYYY